MSGRLKLKLSLGSLILVISLQKSGSKIYSMRSESTGFAMISFLCISVSDVCSSICDILIQEKYFAVTVFHEKVCFRREKGH